LLVIKINRISPILYITAGIITFVPVFVVLVTDIYLNSILTKIIIFPAFILLIAGKIVTITKNNKKDKRNSKDIGIVIGYLIALVLCILK